MCLGDICISHGIQEVYNREKDHSRGATIFILLMVAGGFKNSAALRLHLAYGCDIIGMYGTAVMMQTMLYYQIKAVSLLLNFLCLTVLR